MNNLFLAVGCLGFLYKSANPFTVLFPLSAASSLSDSSSSLVPLPPSACLVLWNSSLLAGAKEGKARRE
jgi:hypothetical protein